MPRKLRQLKSDYRRLGFKEDARGGKGSYSKWTHSFLPGLTTVLSGQNGEEVEPYQERDLQDATKRLREGSSAQQGGHMDERVNAANVPGPEWEKVRRYAMVIEWSDEDQLFLVSIPDFPGAHTHGRTRAEAAAMGEEVIALLLDGEVKPPPARFTAMSHPIRREAEVGEFITAGNVR